VIVTNLGCARQRKLVRWNAGGTTAEDKTELLSILSYNIGAKDDQMFASCREAFQAELEAQFIELVGDTTPQVICLQECAPIYLRFILEILPAYKHVDDDAEDGTCILVNFNIGVLSKARHMMFDAHTVSAYKRWRRYTRVKLDISLAATQGSSSGGGKSIIYVNNVHIIDGQRERKIPGNADGQTGSVNSRSACDLNVGIQIDQADHARLVHVATLPNQCILL